MKLTPKRKRTDTAKAAVEATQAAMLPPLKPPKHITLRACDRPFWKAIVLARPRDTWTDADLILAATLARCYADIEMMQAAINDNGLFVDGKANPAVDMLDKASRRAMGLTRALAVNCVATVGRRADIAKGATLERNARANVDADDDLIPRLRAV
jgi:hypothetical protein